MLFRRYPIQNIYSFFTVDSTLIGVGCVLCQRTVKANWIIFLIFLKFSQLLNNNTTANRELFGIVFSLTGYEHNIISPGAFINVFNDHKPISSWFTKKGNLSPIFYTAQMQLSKFQKLRLIYTNGINLSVGDIFGRSFTQTELQLI